MDETLSRPRGRPSPEAKARRARPRTRPRHKPNERDERGFHALSPVLTITLLITRTWRARVALYSALPHAAPREFFHLVEAASSAWPLHPLFRFGQRWNRMVSADHEVGPLIYGLEDESARGADQGLPSGDLWCSQGGGVL